MMADKFLHLFHQFALLILYNPKHHESDPVNTIWRQTKPEVVEVIVVTWA